MTRIDRDDGLTLTMADNRGVPLDIGQCAPACEGLPNEATVLLEFITEGGPTLSLPKGLAKLSIHEGRSA